MATEQEIKDFMSKAYEIHGKVDVSCVVVPESLKKVFNEVLAEVKGREIWDAGNRATSTINDYKPRAGKQ